MRVSKLQTALLGPPPAVSSQVPICFAFSSPPVRLWFWCVSTLDPAREIYPNAPLKLVTFELRCAPFELSTSIVDGFVGALKQRYPIRGPAIPQLVLGPGGPGASATGARLFDGDRREAVTLDSQRLTFETARYRRFEQFRASVAQILDTIKALDLVVLPVRVGLRYIDEIDQELLSEPRDWTRYIAPALTAPLEHFDPAPLEHQSAALFGGSGGQNVVLRYGLMQQPVVDPAGPLVIDAPPQGPYYLIDIDSAWQGEADAAPLAEWVLPKLDDLHAPIRHLFETAITDELRNELLRKEKEV
jgi:uncharacterized protein (TIGR04255 family)